MSHGEEHYESGWITLAAAGALTASGILLRFLFDFTLISMILLLGAMVLSGVGIARAGIRALFHGSISVDLLITIAAVGATFIGHVEEGASVLFLFNLAER